VSTWGGLADFSDCAEKIARVLSVRLLALGEWAANSLKIKIRIKIKIKIVILILILILILIQNLPPKKQTTSASSRRGGRLSPDHQF
jgi:hypothetical protein